MCLKILFAQRLPDSFTDGMSFCRLFDGGTSAEHCDWCCPLGWRRSTGEVVIGSGRGIGWTDWMADAPEERNACNRALLLGETCVLLFSRHLEDLSI